MDFVIGCILLNGENTGFRMTVSFLDEESLKAPFTPQKKNPGERTVWEYIMITAKIYLVFIHHSLCQTFGIILCQRGVLFWA